MRSRLTIVTIAIAAAIAAAVASCSRPDAGAADGARLPVVVSIEPQRAIAEAIGGDRVEVTTLLSSGDDPETFDPTMATIMALGRSRLWLRVGTIPFEDELMSRLASGSDLPPSADTSHGIDLITGTHHHHHHHDDEEGDEECDHDGDGHDADDEADPHTWSSVRNLRIMARNMLAALAEADPDGAGYYAGRHASLDSALASLDSVYTARLAPVRGKSFMVWHPTLSYFARDYGLRQIAVSPDHRETSLLQLQGVIHHATEEGVEVFFGQDAYDPRLSAVVKTHIGAECATFSPLAYEWQAGLDTVVATLAAHYSGATEAHPSK